MFKMTHSVSPKCLLWYTPRICLWPVTTAGPNTIDIQCEQGKSSAAFTLVISKAIYTGEHWGLLHWWAVGLFTLVSSGAIYTGEQRDCLHWWAVGPFTQMNGKTIYTGEQQGHLHWWAVGPFTLVSSGAIYTGEQWDHLQWGAGAIYVGPFTLVSNGAVYTGELGPFTLVSSGAVYTGEDVYANPGLGMRHCLYTWLSGWDRCQPRSALFCSMAEHSSHRSTVHHLTSLCKSNNSGNRSFVRILGVWCNEGITFLICQVQMTGLNAVEQDQCK